MPLMLIDAIVATRFYISAEARRARNAALIYRRANGYYEMMLADNIEAFWPGRHGRYFKNDFYRYLLSDTASPA